MPNAAPPNPHAPVDTPALNAERVRVNEAIQRLKQRGALKDDNCPQCGVFSWQVSFNAIPSAAVPTAEIEAITDFLRSWAASSSSWSYIPALILTCKNCGYTMIYNLKTIGLLGGE